MGDSISQIDKEIAKLTKLRIKQAKEERADKSDSNKKLSAKHERARKKQVLSNLKQSTGKVAQFKRRNASKIAKAKELERKGVAKWKKGKPGRKKFYKKAGIAFRKFRKAVR